MFNKVLQWLGLAPTPEDIKLRQLISNSYKSVRVVGRGTVKIDPVEVANSLEFKQAKQSLKHLVK